MTLTNETVERASRAPTTFAAWVLREALEELIARRAGTWSGRVPADSPESGTREWDERPTSVAFRLDDPGLGGHVQVSVFVGRNPGARGRAGTLTLRAEEWEEIRQHPPGVEIIAPLEPKW